MKDNFSGNFDNPYNKLL